MNAEWPVAARTGAIDDTPGGRGGMRVFFRGFVGYNLLMMSLGAGVLLVIVVAAFLFGNRVQEQAGDALRASRIDRLVLELIGDLVDAETSQRGFLITDRESYLQPYHVALVEFERDAAELLRRVPELDDGRVVQIATVEHLIGLGRRKLELVKHNLELARTGRIDEARDVISSDVGKEVMDQIRADGASIRDSAADYRIAQAAAMRASADTLALLISLCAAMIIVLVMGAASVVGRHTRELQAARRALEAANSGLEDRVRERTEEIVRANQEVQRYAYIVSHDLRAPLVNIMGFTAELESAAETLREFVERQGAGRDDPEHARVRAAIDVDVPEALGFIRTSMTRMDGLINEILKLSRAGRRALEPAPISARELMETCIASIRHRFDEAGATVSIEGTLPELVSDPAALSQILTNLLDNAAKYLVVDRPGRIVVRGRIAGPSAVFDIEDNGRGIAPNDHERIFDLFRRAGVQDRPGDGIGLAHSRALARRLGGDVTVDSDGHSGTVFHVYVARDLAARLRSGHS